MNPNEKGFGRETPETQPAAQGINYLLSIGVDAYVHCPQLYNAVKDAQAFVNLLTDKYQFEKTDVRTLINEEATQKNIFEALKTYVHEVTPDDNLVIYFSGHGEFDEELDEGYWIPVEAELGLPGEYISNSQVMKYIRAIKSRHTFLVADSCFSGSLFTQRKLSPKERLEKDPSRWLLSSGRNEVVSDGKPGDHSPFADNLLYFLEKNVEASIPITDLVNNVIDITMENADQTPRGEPLSIEAHKGGQFFFHLKKNEERDWTTAKELDTVNAYQHFLETYSNGQFAEEAAWQLALIEGTIINFLNYRKAFPEGMYHKEALLQIACLEEEETWRKTQQRDVLADYLSYLEKYPDGKYIKEADEKVNALQSLLMEDDFWEKAKTGGHTEDYQSYLEQFPEGKFKAQALQFLEGSIEKREIPPVATTVQEDAVPEVYLEEEVWTKAQQINTKEAYQSYLQNFPQGKFSDLAKKQLQGLRGGKRNKKG